MSFAHVKNVSTITGMCHFSMISILHISAVQVSFNLRPNKNLTMGLKHSINHEEQFNSP